MLRRARIRSISIVAVSCFALASAGCDKKGGGASTSNESPAASHAKSGPAASADDQAAAEFFQGRIEEHWVKNAEGWTTQLQRRNAFGQPMEGVPGVLFLQYRDLKYDVRPVALTESQKLNGTTYRAEITFEYVPTRRFHTEHSIEAPPGWSNWDEEQPAAALVVERRNGKWLMTDAEMLAGLLPSPAAIPK